MLGHPNSYGIIWTPGLIKKTVNEIFSPDTAFYDIHPEGPVISDPYELEELGFIEIIELHDQSGYAFDYQLPLNNEWSDLTAQFEFTISDNEYAVFLDDLHVL